MTEVDANALAKRLLKLKLNEELIGKLEELKTKGVSINMILLEFLNEREMNTLEEKVELEQKRRREAEAEAEATGQMADNTDVFGAGDRTNSNPEHVRKHVSRHIPVAVTRVLGKIYGTKCAMPGCTQDAENYHHKIRFNSKRCEEYWGHSPYNVLPVCKGHHDLTHADDADVQRYRRMKEPG